jgi:hypothetical protein
MYITVYTKSKQTRVDVKPEKYQQIYRHVTHDGAENDQAYNSWSHQAYNSWSPGLSNSILRNSMDFDLHNKHGKCWLIILFDSQMSAD